MQEISQGKALTKAGGQERLLSYFLIVASKRIDMFLEYIEKGFTTK
jgi:hypothetical protein